MPLDTLSARYTYGHRLSLLSVLCFHYVCVSAHILGAYGYGPNELLTAGAQSGREEPVSFQISVKEKRTLEKRKKLKFLGKIACKK